jgi:hypothetical protein
MSERSEPEDVSVVLTRVLRSLEIEAELLSHAVEPAWPRVAGPRLAPHARASSLRNGVLVVEARSAAWMNELSLRRDELKAGFNRELRRELVRDVRFRLGGGFPPLPLPREMLDEAEQKRLHARALGLLGGESTTEGGQLVAGALAARLRQSGGGSPA